MKRKSMITMLVIALMLVLSLFALSGCKKDKDDPPATYSVTVTNGTGGGEYAEGATVKIKANAPETGKEFTSWTLDGVAVDNASAPELTFTMPANAVTATANYGDVQYEFALENCTADKETAKFGEEVTFTADEVIGKRFDSWNIKGVDDLTGLDLTKSPLTFTMPANDINVAAVLEDIDYTVTVTGGTTDKETAHYGDTVTITANEPETGKEFTSWTLSGVTVDDKTKAEITFTMPANEVTATAVFEDVYEMALENCTSDKEVARHGEPVTFTAGEYEGKRFTGWYIKGVDTTGLDLTKSPLTINMPANDIVVAAQYEQLYKITVGVGCTTDKEYAAEGEEVTVTKPAPEIGFANWWQTTGIVKELDNSQHTVTFKMPANNIVINYINVRLNFSFVINNGTASGLKFKKVESVTDGSTGFDYNCDVTITANTPEIGKEFSGWTITGIDTSGLDLTASELTFKMPANEVIATANYKNVDYTVTVNGGTANKTTARYGDSITITAAAPETGKRFTGWTLEGVTVENTSVDELTFTMPAGNVTATANYEFIDYTVTVVGGTANKTTAHYGDSITITAEIPTGMSFAGWTLEGVTAETGGFSINFTMPANNVTATAKYVYNNYNVTVNGGTAQVNDGVASASVKAHYGEEVTITAEVPVGKEFVMWSFDGLVPDGLTLTDAELTFTMPTNAVTATAVFEDIDYEVKVICHNIETKTAHYGEEVTITAENIEGKIFVCWAFTNLDTEGLDLTRAELSFTMPANNVTAKAIYEELITLTFEGTTAQSEELQYKDNDSKSFRLPLGSGQDLCTYTIELSNSAFTFKVYGSDGVEIEPYDNGDGFMCIDIEREDNYTIRVVNTGSAANCTLTVTQI